MLSPIRDRQGRVIGICKVARDITARKRSEQALARAKDIAELASQELEAFSYSVAHDLRAPLRGMMGFAHLLLEGYEDSLDAEGKDWLDEINKNANKMAELIDGLLSLSAVTRSEPAPQSVDLSAIVRSTAGMLAAAEPERQVQVVTQDGVRGDMDPRLATTLIANLIGNAWKFTAKSASPRIEFGVDTQAGAKTYFVRDNGAGFDMAFAGKLFAPFQRLHTQSEFPGTGIGLATVQRIVQSHEGKVWASGVVGKGATFFFSLRQANAERGR